MKASVIIRFILLGLLWAGLVAWIIIGTPRFTLYTAFVIVASAIIIFVPVYKKYVKNAKKVNSASPCCPASIRRPTCVG